MSQTEVNHLIKELNYLYKCRRMKPLYDCAVKAILALLERIKELEKKDDE